MKLMTLYKVSFGGKNSFNPIVIAQAKNLFYDSTNSTLKAIINLKINNIVGKDVF